ncbi:MAG: Tm-1-like ATP-binding domain-containing protein [Verrucomicrobiales bacterium]|nr:Tm-1-like ATP-binding domain-containing protein [Verrucomicrobiales bacterium]
MAGKRIAVIGTLDTKGAEHAYVADCLREFGHRPLLIDLGTGGPATVTPEITRAEVAATGGLDLAALVATGDRGTCVAAMCEAAPVLLARLAAEGLIDGVISLGGGGGTALGTAAMRALPVGFPKLMVSTMASGHTAPYVGSKDIVMFPSIVDVSGLNRISRPLFRQAAAAIAGMVDAGRAEAPEDRPLIAASMFGNTTRCVELARAVMERAGYEVLVFHATGTGGRTLETLIGDGLMRGVLDITTTEWADELVGGVLTAGPHRLEAAARAGVPAIVVPGCLDMVNFGARDTVPARFAGRTFHLHNPQVTLMRTTPEECAELGRIVAEKVNASTGPVRVLVPTRAISLISAPGQPFHDPEADAALFESLRRHLDPAIPLVEMDAAINDEVFAEACAESLLELLRRD